MGTMRSVKQLYEQWLSLQPLSKENQERLDRKFNLEFNYNSNNIEGNTLTYGQTELLLMFGNTTGDARLRDYEEMSAHNVALKAIQQEAENADKPLTELFIRELNELILVKPFFKDAVTPDGRTTRRKINIGSYKKNPNHVITATGETFHYATPEETSSMMAGLIKWYNDESQKGELHPIELASLLHYRYIRIHPFEDGNGRIARLLVNYVLLRNSYPMLVIKSENKERYILALHKSDINAGLTPSDGANATLEQIQPFVEYMTEQLEYSLRLCIKAGKGESLDEPKDVGKKLQLLQKELGSSPEESVKYKYGDEALLLVVKNTIEPIVNAWEEQMKEFDSVILDRSAVGRYGLGTKSATNLTALLSAMKTDPNFEKAQKLNRVSVGVSTKGLINMNNNVSIDGGRITFDFHPNAYEISNSRNKKTLAKLYHQGVSESEISEIVEALGNQLLDAIEDFKNSKK